MFCCHRAELDHAAWAEGRCFDTCDQSVQRLALCNCCLREIYSTRQSTYMCSLFSVLWRAEAKLHSLSSPSHRLPPSLPVTFTWFRSRGIVTFVMSGRRDTAAAWRWSQLVCACIECRCACRVCITCLKSTRKGQWHRQYVNWIYACGRMCRKRFIALM